MRFLLLSYAVLPALTLQWRCSATATTAVAATAVAATAIAAAATS
jgi:hypothetical protein